MSSGVVGEIKAIEYHWNQREEPETGAEHFSVTAEVFVGEVGGDDGAEQFEVVAYSPSAFLELCRRNWDDDFVAVDLGVLPGGAVAALPGVWLMKRWSRTAFEHALAEVVSSCSPAPDFDTLAARIGRVIPWDYDYRYDAKVNRDAGLSAPQGASSADDSSL